MARAGLTERLEVRLDGEPLVRLRGAEDDTGDRDDNEDVDPVHGLRTRPTMFASCWRRT